MKKRMGFVSNSSSSSFCILGVTSEEITDQVKSIPTQDEDGEDVDFDWYEYNSKDLTVHSGISDYYDLHCIGISPGAMDENLTVIQNKEVVAEKINKAFGTTFTKDDIGFMTDGGHD